MNSPLHLATARGKVEALRAMLTESHVNAEHVRGGVRLSRLCMSVVG